MGISVVDLWKTQDGTIHCQRISLELGLTLLNPLTLSNALLLVYLLFYHASLAPHCRGQECKDDKPFCMAWVARQAPIL
jgi:hypothetical protein